MTRSKRILKLAICTILQRLSWAKVCGRKYFSFERYRNIQHQKSGLRYFTGDAVGRTILHVNTRLAE